MTTPKLGDLVYIEFEDAIMDDSEYIYLNTRGGVVNKITGHTTSKSLTCLPAYFIARDPDWLLVAWLHSPRDEDSKWTTTFRIPRKWIKTMKGLKIGAKI